MFYLCNQNNKGINMNAVSLNNLWTYIQGLSLIEIKVQILLRSTIIFRVRRRKFWSAVAEKSSFKEEVAQVCIGRILLQAI